MNIQILSDKHEHICEAIDRVVKSLDNYRIHSDSELLKCTKQHYKDLLAEELRILKDD